MKTTKLFLNYKKTLEVLNGDYATLFRFLYLCTFADDEGLLKFGEYKYNKHHDNMDAKDFEEVLNLSTRGILSLKNSLFENLLIIDNGCLIVNNDFCTTTAKRYISNNRCARIDVGMLRELYKQNKPTEHKKIGRIFSLLDSVSEEGIIKVLNKDSCDVIPARSTDIARLMNLSISKASRTVKEYENCCVYGEGLLKYEHDASYFKLNNVFIALIEFKDLFDDDEKYSVYIHTTPNNKKYIGITSLNPEKRWRTNGEGYKTQVFWRAIEKYGWDNIEHDVLFHNMTAREACKIEIQLIEKYNTTNPLYGYNISTGGECRELVS